MNKKIPLLGLTVFLFCIGSGIALADVTTGLALTIAPNGDVPAVQVACAGTNASLYVYPHNFSTQGIVAQRVGCAGGVASFVGFNMNVFLQNHVDLSWWNYWNQTTDLAIKDTTGLAPGLSWQSYQGLLNLCGGFDNYNCAQAYDPANTEWQTLGAGPAFTSTDHGVTWTNFTNGDGTANYTTSTTPVLVGDSNVLFLPGLESSRLYVDKTVLGVPVKDQLWEPNASSDGVDLYLNPDGTSVKPNIYTNDVINVTNLLGPVTATQNIYQGFSNMMDGLVHDGKIANWQAYAYDWRQSVQDIVNNGTQYKFGNVLSNVSLTETLKGLVDSSKNGKVTIIAHSNGGLLAKALLKKLEDDKATGKNTLIDHIDVVILVATPQLGTPTAIPGLLHGYDQDIDPFGLYNFIDKPTARALAQNMPSAYGLLPSAEYFNHVSYPVVSFVPNASDPYMSKDVAMYTTAINSYAGEKNFMTGTDGRTNPTFADTLKPIIAGANLFTQAESLHSSIDTMTVPANIRVVQIAGWGVDTIAGFQYQANDVCANASDTGCTGKYLLDEVPVFTADGDKTVVTPSALAMSGEKWWVNIKKYNDDKPLISVRNMHKNILEAQPILDFINKTVQNASTTSSIYMSTTTPVDTSNRLHLSVHSPVTLDAYDTNDNHTGKVCPTPDTCYTEENIPNSGYYEFGEGKYITLPQTGLQKVSLQGTDVGTFTFDYQTVTPSGQTNTVSFQDIPVTTQTQAVITTNATSSAPQLALDVTGDGVTDFTLLPSTIFDPVTYLQVMKATIDSLDLTDAKKKAFDTRIDNIIKLIQKGKVDKAKLKADKFITVLKNRIAKPDPKKPRPKKLSKTDAQTLLDLLNGLLDNLN